MTAASKMFIGSLGLPFLVTTPSWLHFHSTGVAYTPPVTDRSDSRTNFRVVLAGMVLIVVVLQIVSLSGFQDLRFFQKYWKLAGELNSGAISPERLNDVSPLYLWVVTMLKSIGLSPAGIRIVQLLMNGLTSLLAAMVAFRVAGPLAAVMTAGFVIANRAMFINATELEPEALIALLNTAGLYFLFGTARYGGRRAFVAGLMFGLSAAARLVVLPASLLTGAIALWCSRRQTAHPVRAFALPYLAGLLVPLLGAVAVTFALTGNPSIMNPGTVFYEGWNPYTSGYTLTEPLIVSDVRVGIDAPDPLHLAYRLIASRITGDPPSPKLSNSFWTEKALEFVGTFPNQAARLGLAKLFFSVHSYEAWDLPQMVGRFRETSGVFWAPFGLLVALALISLIDRLRDPIVIGLWLYSVCYLAVLVAFYVSSRQRNAVVPVMAILAGIGVAAIVTSLRKHPRGALLRAALVIVLAILLTRPYRWQAENAYQWTAAFNSEAVVAKLREAEREGRNDDAMRLRAIDRTWLLGDDPHIPSAPKALVAAVAKGELSRADEHQRIFDLALALQYAGDWETSERILAFLHDSGYRPVRQTKAVDSVSYYRALAHLHSGRHETAERFLQMASNDAPADAYVLALRVVLLDDAEARRQLSTVHDRFTAEMAIARAYYETGNIHSALGVIRRVTAEMPEWNRARLLEAYLTDVSTASSTVEPVLVPVRMPPSAGKD